MFEKRILNFTVLIAALGYFVDVFDLFLFSILRVSSLKDLGVPDAELLEVGVMLLNSQMAGLLFGGLLWGVLGDRRGRVSVLFGSILLYSAANIANAFVTDVSAYALFRFLAGMGLAGEVGAAITLVSEILPTDKRGYGTTLVAGVGLSGSVVAAIVAEFLTWRYCYALGGALGLALLLARLRLKDPQMYLILKEREVARGKLLLLLSDRKRFLRYLGLILVGTPIWFAVGILVTFSPEFAKFFGLQQSVTAGQAVLFTYIGVVLGDFMSGALSQKLKDRRAAIGVFLVLLFATSTIYLQFGRLFDGTFYVLCACIGISTGYWVVLMTMAAEKFGTNLRATVTTTVPNFIRGAAVPITLGFTQLKGSMGLIGAAQIVGIITLSLATIALFLLTDSYGRDLNFVEHDPI